jgi:hypothetical protein
MAKPWRPDMNDVDRLSKGGGARKRGTGNTNIPHRLNNEERPVYESAKKKVCSDRTVCTIFFQYSCAAVFVKARGCQPLLFYNDEKQICMSPRVQGISGTALC